MANLSERLTDATVTTLRVASYATLTLCRVGVICFEKLIISFVSAFLFDDEEWSSALWDMELRVLHLKGPCTKIVAQ